MIGQSMYFKISYFIHKAISDNIKKKILNFQNEVQTKLFYCTTILPYLSYFVIRKRCGSSTIKYETKFNMFLTHVITHSMRLILRINPTIVISSILYNSLRPVPSARKLSFLTKHANIMIYYWWRGSRQKWAHSHATCARAQLTFRTECRSATGSGKEPIGTNINGGIPIVLLRDNARARNYLTLLPPFLISRRLPRKWQALRAGNSR